VRPRALVIPLVLAAGCPKGASQRTPCTPGSPSKVELRDAAGQLVLAVKQTPEPGTYDLCNASGGQTGKLEWALTAVKYTDDKGVLKLKLTAESKTDATGVSTKGSALRIHVNGPERRVLKPDGIPIGSVVVSGADGDGKTTVFDPASRPVARVEPRDHDQVIRGADGSTRSDVVPSASSAAAAAFALDGLPPEERATLYLFWNK
jgi:hypothetical protein